MFVGQDLYSGSSFVYHPWVLYARGLITAPNLVLAGIVRAGKSALAKSLYTRSIPFGRRVYVPGDPKGEHTAVAEAVGGRAIALGHGMPTRLNPLDEGHRPAGLDDIQWAAQVTSRRRDLLGALAETVLDRRLTPLEHTAIDVALADPDGGQRWVVYDEAWRLMSHPALLRRMDAHWRLARHYGIANMLIFHKLSDLDNVGDQGPAMRALASSLLANAETRVVYRQESDQLGSTAVPRAG
ncbi:hypothetical protein BJF86_06305 [Serinicoccus sp. CNJ-927]|nr:hypothetical protein BJF86_06305 [Serinicoccus sp. CNJ-927]